MLYDRINSVIGKRGLFMCRNACVFFLQRLKRKHVKWPAQFKKHGDVSCHQVFFPCKARRWRRFTPFWEKHYGNMHHCMPPSKTGWPSFNMVNFPTCDAPRPGWTKTVTILEIIHQIHELILEDCWVSAKSIAEQLGISCERVGSIIHEDLDMQKLSKKWVP